ncbi:MAG: DUF58 domain-containing protein [Chloroflexi bacterium]|nr:DUF58 domain-containing protein [Chloroflexota bacterium]
MPARIKLNSLLFPILAVAALILQVIDPSRIWKALLISFGGAWLIAWIWAYALKNNLRLTREVRYEWAQVGDTLEEQFTLKNNGLFPAAWVEVQDHSTLPNYSTARATGAGSDETNTWHTRGVCTRRGVYTLGGTTLHSGDPLGIYTIEIDQPESSILVVMPPVIPLPSIEIMPGGWMGDGRSRSNSLERTVNVLNVREYEPGEPLKLIHWPTTARRGKLYSRVLDSSPASDWWIVLDADAKVQAGHDWESTMELGVILAASLAARGLQTRHSVGLLSNGLNHQQTVWLKPQSNEAQRLQIMRALAMLEPGTLPLADLLERAAPTLGQRTSLVVITPSIKSDWLSPLTQLWWKGISPTVLLMDPSTFGARQHADSLANVLAGMGIPRFILSRDLLQRSEADPTLRSKNEWRIMPTGKAVPTRPQKDMDWRRLG